MMVRNHERSQGNLAPWRARMMTHPPARIGNVHHAEWTKKPPRRYRMGMPATIPLYYLARCPFPRGPSSSRTCSSAAPLVSTIVSSRATRISHLAFVRSGSSIDGTEAWTSPALVSIETVRDALVWRPQSARRRRTDRGWRAVRRVSGGVMWTRMTPGFWPV